MDFIECKTHLFDDFDRQGEICIRYIAAPVYFMLSKAGIAVEIIHIGADGREGKRGLRKALTSLVSHVRDTYPACTMLIALNSLKSTYNLGLKIGAIDCGLVGNEKGRLNMMVVYYGRHSR